MKLIFDFDHTLFSTRKLYFALKEAFRKIGVGESLFQETLEKSRRKGKGRVYKPNKQFKLIIKAKPEISLKKLERAFKKVLSKAPKFLYKDTAQFLRKWQRKSNLILLSYGEEKFQKDKIKASKIRRFFKRIIITQDINKLKSSKKIFQNKGKAIFVEDNPQVLSKIKKIFPNVIMIRINRGEGKYAKEPNNPQIDFSINNLKELEKILKKE